MHSKFDICFSFYDKKVLQANIPNDTVQCNKINYTV